MSKKRLVHYMIITFISSTIIWSLIFAVVYKVLIMLDNPIPLQSINDYIKLAIAIFFGGVFSSLLLTTLLMITKPHDFIEPNDDEKH